MRSRNEQQDPTEPNSYRELRILSEVEGASDITQRQLSQRVGIALGLTNALLRNLIKKGYLRGTQANWKRWVYALTPEGFSHKLRLTVAYIRRVLVDYQSIRQTLREQMEPLALHEESRVAIYGTGEFAELVYLGLKELGIEEIDVFDSVTNDGSKFLAMPVRDTRSLDPSQYDRILIARLGGSETASAELRAKNISPGKMVVFFPDGNTIEAG